MTPEDTKLLKAYDNFIQESYDNCSLHPVNCQASLTHWRVIILLISNLDSAKEYIRRFRPPTSDQLEVTDSHFHIEVIAGELSTPNISSQNIIDYNPSNYVIKGAVANFVYPMEWPSTPQLEAQSLDSRL